MRHPTVEYIYNSTEGKEVAIVKDGSGRNSEIYFCDVETLDLVDVKKSKKGVVILIDPDERNQRGIKVEDKVELNEWLFTITKKNLEKTIRNLVWNGEMKIF